MNGLYEVSNLGRIRRIRFINGKYNFEKIKECKQTLNTCGYMTVNLSKNGKSNTKRVHKLVAIAFLGESNLQIDHIDGNKLNNKVDNLEYCTSDYNLHYGTRIKRIAKNHRKPILSENKSGEIKIYCSIDEAADSMKIDKSALIRCCKNKQKTSKGLKWFYIDEFIRILSNERDEYKDKLSQIRETFLKYDWKNSNKEEIYNQLKELYERIFGVKVIDE